MKTKSIIILGGAKDQLEMIHLCKKKDFYTIVLDINSQCIGRKFCDKFYEISINDIDKIYEVAKYENVIGVCSMITEAGVLAIYEVCDKLNLPNLYSLKSAKATFSKNEMRSIFNESDLNDIPYVNPKNLNDLELFCERVGLPIVLKSSDSGGQRGLFKIESKDDIENCYSRSIENSTGGVIIAEKYAEGDEINCVFTVYNGEVKELIISDRIKDKDSFGIVKRHRYPSKYNLVLSEIKRKCQCYVDVLEIENGVVFPQFIIDKNQKDSYLLELGLRIPGGLMNKLFEHVTGFNLVSYCLDIATGDVKEYKMYHTYKTFDNVLVTFLNSSPGPLKLGEVNSFEISKSDKVLNSGFFVQIPPNLNIPPLMDGASRFYYFINGAKTLEEANTDAESIYDGTDFFNEEKESLKIKNFDFNYYLN